MRSALALLLSLLSCWAAPVGFNNPMPSLQYRLIGWWAMNDGSGSSTADSSGLGNTGTLYNSPTWPAAVIGKGLQFNGSSSYMDAPCPIASTNALSVSMWVKNLSDGSIKGFFELMSSDGVQLVCIYICSTYNGYLLTRRNTSTWTLMAGSVIATANWNHLVITVPAGGNTMTLYINGVSNSATTVTSLDPWTASGHLTIGRGYNTSLYATVVMDDVRVYSRELNVDEVNVLFHYR